MRLSDKSVFPTWASDRRIQGGQISEYQRVWSAEQVNSSYTQMRANARAVKHEAISRAADIRDACVPVANMTRFNQAALFSFCPSSANTDDCNPPSDTSPPRNWIYARYVYLLCVINMFGIRIIVSSRASYICARSIDSNWRIEPRDWHGGCSPSHRQLERFRLAKEE